MALLPQKFSCRQAEGQSLTAASEVPRDHVLSIVDRVERVLLDWEEVLDATSCQLTCGSLMDLREGAELSIGHVVGLEALRTVLFARQARIITTSTRDSCTYHNVHTFVRTPFILYHTQESKSELAKIFEDRQNEKSVFPKNLAKSSQHQNEFLLTFAFVAATPVRALSRRVPARVVVRGLPVVV